MLLSNGQLHRRRSISLRRELSLLELPANDGVSFQTFAGIEREKLSVIEGADNLLIYGDADANNTHCRSCGSLLYSVVRDGLFVHVAMGTLIDAPSIRPTAHIFVGSKAPWFEISDGLPQYEQFAT